MNRRDAEAMPWMEKFTRNPWPKKVVWHQGNVTHERFYWLSLPEGVAKKDQVIAAEVTGQTVRISAKGVSQLELNLSDKLLDLDKPVSVTVNGGTVFSGRVQRRQETLEASLHERADPVSAYCAKLPLKW
jgi:hypothetical protein